MYTASHALSVAMCIQGHVCGPQYASEVSSDAEGHAGVPNGWNWPGERNVALSSQRLSSLSVHVSSSNSPLKKCLRLLSTSEGGICWDGALGEYLLSPVCLFIATWISLPSSVHPSLCPSLPLSHLPSPNSIFLLCLSSLTQCVAAVPWDWEERECCIPPATETCKDPLHHTHEEEDTHKVEGIHAAHSNSFCAT